MEIKFKVWNDKDKFFAADGYNYFINKHGKLFIGSEVANGEYEIEPCKDFMKPVFLAGKEDRNGIEWKEGDIFNISTGNNMILIHDETEYPGWKFEYLSGPAKGMKVSAHVNALSKEEIIGNKFENPELIEALQI